MCQKEKLKKLLKLTLTVLREKWLKVDNLGKWGKLTRLCNWIYSLKNFIW